MKQTACGPTWLPSAIVVALASVLVAAAPAQTSIGRVQGEWRNAKNSVHIRTYACGDQICGVISWANEKAEADARRGGTQQLRGTQVFREFRATGDGGYKGKVFVPDLNRVFSGQLRVSGQDTLIGKGCILGGLICKSTTWLRIQ